MKETLKENLKPVIFIVIVLVLSAISAYPQLKLGGRVVEVIDGKTCVIQLPAGKLTAVLQFIEVPDPEQPFHQTVKTHLGELVLDKIVEFRPRGVMEGKTVGQIYIKGVDVGQQMLRDGAAWYSVAEKNSQDEDESLVYQNNEGQAKTEKRGVWGVANLKPVWEFRAEKAAAQKRLENDELTRGAFITEMQNQSKKLARSQPAAAAAKVEMWADVGGASQFDQPLGFGGLRAGYDPKLRAGHISTPSIFLDFPGAGFLKPVESRLFYVYKGDKGNVEDSVYVVGFMVSSKNYMFVKSNALTLTADSQKFVIGKAKRFSHQDKTGAQELLVYRITRAQLMKLVKAEKILVQIGPYKGGITNESITFINNLLNAS